MLRGDISHNKSFHYSFSQGARLCVRFRASALICDYLIFNREHAGESILYLWVERIREFLVEKSHSSGPVIQEEKVNVTAEEDVEDGDEGGPDLRVLRETAEKTHFFLDQANDEEIPPIKHGSPITDRRSTFQPHLAPVVTPRQVKMVLEKLYENKKIASATHNIYAYRIYCEDKHSFLQDCEDDGETAAGGRLLHLLQVITFVRSALAVQPHAKRPPFFDAKLPKESTEIISSAGRTKLFFFLSLRSVLISHSNC
uniref:Impact RWD domain protein n=1 Tax=Poecilia reticulata TaxID=8081 RepID=A0A3P9Q8H0_POERE